MSFRSSFFRARPKPAAAAVERIKDWTRAGLALPDGATVAVNEIVCADPACPGTETVILVMEPGRKTRALKVPKALDDVGEDDVTAALSAPPSA